jgi:hypothetical protein
VSRRTGSDSHHKETSGDGKVVSGSVRPLKVIRMLSERIVVYTAAPPRQSELHSAPPALLGGLRPGLKILKPDAVRDRR